MECAEHVLDSSGPIGGNAAAVHFGKVGGGGTFGQAVFGGESWELGAGSSGGGRQSFDSENSALDARGLRARAALGCDSGSRAPGGEGAAASPARSGGAPRQGTSTLVESGGQNGESRKQKRNGVLEARCHLALTLTPALARAHGLASGADGEE
jgi:hypothetical protein